MWEKPAQIASKLFLNALLSPPWQCLLFRCLLTVCAVCFVYLQVCCDSRANSKGNWLSSLFLSLSGVLLVLVIVLVAARSLWICKHGHVHTHTHTDTDTERGVDVRSGAQFTVNWLTKVAKQSHSAASAAASAGCAARKRLNFPLEPLEFTHFLGGCVQQLRNEAATRQRIQQRQRLVWRLQLINVVYR